jgi:hypothetical protein
MTWKFVISPILRTFLLTTTAKTWRKMLKPIFSLIFFR